MTDAAGLVENRAIDFNVFRERQAYDLKYTNQLQDLGGSQPYDFKRTGVFNPTLVNPRFMHVQPSRRPLNVRHVRYHAPGGMESRAMWDPARILTSHGVAAGYKRHVVQGEQIHENPKPENYYGSLW